MATFSSSNSVITGEESLIPKVRQIEEARTRDELLADRRDTTVTGDYEVTTRDQRILVNAAKAVTITIPASFKDSGNDLLIKDISGKAATNNITITSLGQFTIDGVNSLTISADYGFVGLMSDTEKMFVVQQ